MYVNVYVPKYGGGVVPKSDVYKYSDPFLDSDGPTVGLSESENGTVLPGWKFNRQIWRIHCLPPIWVSDIWFFENFS